MSQAAITRGKEIIKNAIRETLRGEVARIPVADEANLAIFQQALRQHDIQRMLQQRDIRVEFYFPKPPVEQGKRHMLIIISTAGPEVQHIVFPYSARDYADAQNALASSEVQAALQQRNITASIEKIGHDNDPKIVIATYDQVMNGELDTFLENLKRNE
ncbi:MAG: hypothetical protein RMZ69_15340 [Nostoc sp. ChiQUE01a]|nr:hypothetical protein [Nostoc sp. ChiQUE01a]